MSEPLGGRAGQARAASGASHSADGSREQSARSRLYRATRHASTEEATEPREVDSRRTSIMDPELTTDLRPARVPTTPVPRTGQANRFASPRHESSERDRGGASPSETDVGVDEGLARSDSLQPKSPTRRKGQLKVVELPSGLCPRPRPAHDLHPEKAQPRFGSLRFPSSRSAVKPTKWVCVGPSADDWHVGALTELIFSTWNLSPPPVAIGVLGAARPLTEVEMSADVKRAFLEGMSSAAGKTHAWVVTVGTNGGVAALTGEAMRQQSQATGEEAVLLGIAPWRRIHLHDKIEQQMNAMVVDYRVDDSEVIKYPPAWDAKKQTYDRKKRYRERAAIEPNHTHMILVDDGDSTWSETPKMHWGCELDLRIALENFLEKTYEVPMVHVMLNGGTHTLELALQVLCMGRNLIVIGDSGGASSDLYDYCHGENKISGSNNLGRFAWTESEQVAYLKCLKDIRKYHEASANNKQQLTFFLVRDRAQDPAEGDVLEQSSGEWLCDQILESILLSQAPEERLLKAVEWGDQSVITKQLMGASRGTISRALEKALMLTAVSARERYLNVVPILLGLQDVRAGNVSLDRLFTREVNYFQIDGFHEDDAEIMMHKRSTRGSSKSLQTAAGSGRALQFLNQYLGFVGYNQHLKARASMLAQTASRHYGAQLTLAATVIQRHQRAQQARSNDQVVRDIVVAAPLRLTVDSNQQCVVTLRIVLSQRLFLIEDPKKASLIRERHEAAMQLRDRHAASNEEVEMDTQMQLDLRRSIHNEVWSLVAGVGKKSTLIDISQYIPRARLRAGLFKARRAVTRKRVQKRGIVPELTQSSRVSWSFLPPDWTDLAVWATLVGRSDLARHLWEQCAEPVRLGVILSRMVQRLKIQNPEHAQHLSESHILFEGWSREVLDQMNATTARKVLTGVKEVIPATVGGVPAVLAWPRSVMDEAIDTEGYGYPCMMLLSHPHCSRLITAYFNGDCADSMYQLIGPNGRPPKTLAIIFHVITLGLVLILLPEQKVDSAKKKKWWKRKWWGFLYCRLRESESYKLALRQRTNKNAQETFAIQDTCAVTDEAIDTDYITVEGAARNARSWLPQDQGKPRGVLSHGNTGTLRSRRTAAASGIQHQLLIWLVFWRVPYVRYIAQTILDAVCIVCLWILLAFSNGWPYLYVPPYNEDPSSSRYRQTVFQESFVWAYMILRGLEQVGVLASKAAAILKASAASGDIKVAKPLLRIQDLSALWAVLDISLMDMCIACVVIRIKMWIEIEEAVSNNTYPGTDTMERCRTLVNITAILCILASIRFLEAFCFFGNFGETLTMVLKMVFSLIPVLIIITILSIAFGAAFEGMLSQGSLPNHQQEVHLMAHPFFIPWWVLAGHLDRAEVMDKLAPEDSTLAASILWLYAIVMNILLLNLLIALMTSAYESVREQSAEYRLLQRAKQALEYKDVRDALPSWWVVRRCLQFCARPFIKSDAIFYHSKKHGFLAPMPAQEFLKLQLDTSAAKRKALYARAAETDAEDEAQSREEMRRLATMMEHKLKALESRLEKKFGASSEDVELHLTEHLDALEKRIAEMSRSDAPDFALGGAPEDPPEATAASVTPTAAHPPRSQGNHLFGGFFS